MLNKLYAICPTVKEVNNQLENIEKHLVANEADILIRSWWRLFFCEICPGGQTHHNSNTFMTFTDQLEKSTTDEATEQCFKKAAQYQYYVQLQNSARTGQGIFLHLLPCYKYFQLNCAVADWTGK